MIRNRLRTNAGFLVVSFFVLLYIAYFSYFTILRLHTLHAHYYDLGIMHQTVYNTYQALKSQDFSRILEMTSVDSTAQIKRMAIHNDIILALLSPFYFIYSGPETLLLLQVIAVAFGAFAVYGVSKTLFKKNNHSEIISIVFSVCYLLYPPLQRANNFDFHGVVLATPLLLFMYYFYLSRRYIPAFLCFLLAIITKEQVALTTLFFGFYSTLSALPFYFKRIPQIVAFDSVSKPEIKKKLIFGGFIITFSLIWFLVSMMVIIPYFRGGSHFAIGYYGEFGSSPTEVIIGILRNPLSLIDYVFKKETYDYVKSLLGPLAFISLLAPVQLLIALPELAVNVLSKSDSMTNIYFHYTAVITPFVFISSLYGVRTILNRRKNVLVIILLLSVGSTIVFSYLSGPLPFSKKQDIVPLRAARPIVKDVMLWKSILQNETIKVSSTGQLAPFFTSRRVFYLFSDRYEYADYVLIQVPEIRSGYPSRKYTEPAYKKLQHDPHFNLIYNMNGLEVYKKIST